MQGVQEKGFCSGKKIFSYIGRIPVKIAGNQIQQVSNSQYCGRFWKVSLSGEYTVLQAGTGLIR